MMSFQSNPQADSNPESPSDLDWLAFCYLSNELDAAERELFEQNLAGNQACREALARAVELQCAVTAEYAAERQVAASQVELARPEERWVRAATWFTITSAASLAFVAVYWVMNPTATDVAKQSSAAISSQTALLWSEVREADPSDEMDLLVVDVDPLADESLVSDEEEDFSAESHAAVPSWLLTAVSSRSESEVDPIDDSQQPQPESNLPEDL